MDGKCKIYTCIFSLKTQQGLLVDFAQFPQKFIDLLEMCLREEHKEMPKSVQIFRGCFQCCVYIYSKLYLTVSVNVVYSIKC